jgi:hypothetical protein
MLAAVRNMAAPGNWYRSLFLQSNWKEGSSGEFLMQLSCNRRDVSGVSLVAHIGLNWDCWSVCDIEEAVRYYEVAKSVCSHADFDI